MPATTVIGTQWGDEGKGKVLDLIAEKADIVMRFQGGANAGHTVEVKGRRFVFHLLPSGVLHEDKMNLMGNGLVIDPAALWLEIEELSREGIDLSQRLKISGRAHLVMPYHRSLDAAFEKARTERIGTTHRGIGPCYADKISRHGLRFYDLVDFDRFRRKLSALLPLQNRLLQALGHEAPLEEEKILQEYALHSTRLAPFVTDTSRYVREALERDSHVFFEGAQGVLLDVDHGTYPFVTSSNSSALGLPAGAGIPPHAAGHILGVVKAYNTRVGSGPFPTEGSDDENARLRDAGNEFGATTGRPRRCGWLDAVVLRHVVALNGIQGLALTKIDVLGGIKTLKICTRYEIDGREVDRFPDDTDLLGRVKPVYRDLPGWTADISGCRAFDELPREAREYIGVVEKLAGAPAEIVSVGPGREQTIFREVSSPSSGTRRPTPEKET